MYLVISENLLVKVLKNKIDEAAVIVDFLVKSYLPKRKGLKTQFLIYEVESKTCDKSVEILGAYHINGHLIKKICSCNIVYILYIHKRL